MSLKRISNLTQTTLGVIFLNNLQETVNIVNPKLRRHYMDSYEEKMERLKKVADTPYFRCVLCDKVLPEVQDRHPDDNGVVHCKKCLLKITRVKQDVFMKD